MRNLLKALTVLCGIWMPSVHAGPVLDQKFEPVLPDRGGAVSANQSLAQTFTVGLTGILSSVELMVFDLMYDNYLPNPGYFKLSIVPTASGVPVTADSLYSGTYRKGDLTPDYYYLSNKTNFTSFDVSTANILVVVGDVLAIVLSTDTGADPEDWITWKGMGLGDYAGGTKFYTRGGWVADSSGDSAFRTYVVPSANPPDSGLVPEPATIALVAAALLAASLSRGGLTAIR